MTTKEKYELFDKTKINEKVLGILKNMQESSKNFTDESVNSKIDSALDKLIENFRANKPEALLTLQEAKKEVKKEKEKAIKKNKDKDLSEKKDTDDETGLPKKDTIEERKDIIKEESETEKEARDRAKKELEKEKEKAKDEIESQIEKLNRLILEDPALQGFNTGSAATGGGRSTPIIDAERKALPRGSRVSQKGWMNQYGASNGGRKYWENRENRSDRKSPEYETGKPYLKKGGNVYSSDEMYLIAMFKGDVDLDTISIRAKNKAEARMIFEDTYREKYEDKLGDFAIEIYLVKPFPESDSYAQGGVIKAKKLSDWDYSKIFETVNLGLGESFVTILPKNPDGGKIKYGLIIRDASNQFDRSGNISYIFDLDDKYYSNDRQVVKSTVLSPYYDKDKYKEIARGSHFLVITIQGNRKTLLKDLIDKVRYTFFSKINKRNEMDLPNGYPNRFLYDLLVFEGSIKDLVNFCERLQNAFQYEGAKLYTEATPYIMSIIWNIPETTNYKGSVETPATYIPIFELANEVEAKTSKKRKYADGGEVEGVDLFEDYDDQPEEVQAILANYEMEDNDYETLQNLKAELESIGYTMDFGLDAEPYDLRKIGQTGKSEYYAKGGKLNTEVILTENRSNGAKWRGVVKPFMMKSIERNQYGGGFKRYEIDIYDDVEREPSKEELKQANEFFDKVGGRFAKGGLTKTKTGAIKLYYHQTSGGAEYLCSSKVKGTKDEGSFDSEYIVRIDGAKDFGGELLTKVLPYAKGSEMADGGMMEARFDVTIYDEDGEKYYLITYAEDEEDAIRKAENYHEIESVDSDVMMITDYDGKNLYFAKGGEMADGGKLEEEISKIKSLGGDWQSYYKGAKAGMKDDGYVTIENEADLIDYIYDKTGYIVKNIEVIEKGKNYPLNNSNPYFYDTYLVTLKNGSNFTFERSYGRPNWQGNVNYIERIKITNINTKHAKGDMFAEGGQVGDFFYDSRKDKAFQVIFEDGDKMGIQYLGMDKKPVGGVTTITKNEFEYNVEKGSWGKWKQEYAKGGMMADGGEVKPKIYEINDGFHLYYFYGDNKAQVLKYFKMAYDTNKYEQNISIRIMTGSRLKHLEESEEYNYIEDARVVDNINEGDEMAHGGADGGETDNSLPDRMAGFFPINLLKDAYVIKEIKYSKDNSLFTDDYTVRDFKNDFPKEYHNVTLDEAYKLIDELNNTKMADGGEVDFIERMAKMRSAYENLNMIVKSKIAMAVGIDRAISIMENDYSIDPFGLIISAVRGGLLELDEINKDLVNEAVYEAENVTDDYRDSGQGISGSDMTAFTKNVLDSAGYKTDFINNRLERVDEEGNKLEIDKYNMNY
jgi:hypothetical protein